MTGASDMRPEVEVARRLSVGAMVLAGLRAVKVRAGLVAALYGVQLTVSLLFVLGGTLALNGRFGNRPLFARGVGGDDAALISALTAQPGIVSSFTGAAVSLALGYSLLSLYLGAGLLGAFAGRPFGDVAARRFFAFFRLWLLALVPWAIGLVICGIGIHVADLALDDLVAQRLMVGRPLLALAPGLVILAVVSSAVDYARARLVLSDGGAWRALGFGFRRTVTRPAALIHLALYLAVWIGVSALYVAGSYGVAFAGGAIVLFALRQIVCIVRFGARAATSAGQLRALEVEMLEVRQVVERPEAPGDGAEAQVAQPIE